ncbi:MAG: hypothetical protein R3236_06360, partial [Phycisphaeraceae bacterium]|nr:hypothetical protein [Phycisphaeraceae bacterium]
GVGGRVYAKPLHISSGKLAMRLDSGAELTLSGPARLELKDAMTASLIEGDLSAYIPKSAQGFTVRSKAMDVVDRGTRFAFSVRRDFAYVRVSEGSVGVRHRAAGGAAPRNSTLKKDQSLQARAVDGADWQVTHLPKQPRLSGEVRYVEAPPADIESRRYRDIKFGVLYPEQIGATLSQPVEVYDDMADEVADRVLQPGQRVDAYMLHVQRNFRHHEGRMYHYVGSVTFDRPVLGVIWRQTHHTDGVLGLPGLRFQFSPAQRQFDAGEDQFHISEDRRTVHFDVRLGKNRIDRMRIVVAHKADAAD